jgi:hypothetical protein
LDFNSFLKRLQDWTNRIPLIVVGSGASVPFNLPSMWQLGEFLKNHVVLAEKDDIDQFEQFKLLLDKYGDLERALQEIQLRPNVLNEIVYKTWEIVNIHDLEAYDKIVDNKRDFPFANLITHLLSAANRKVSIITTNYDRLVEYAASIAEAFICTGYSQNYFGHFSNTIHQNYLSSLKGYKGQVNIWKVHGSLDWFKTNDDEDIQLPLRKHIQTGFRPSIVTPGISKYYETHNEPYRTIFTQADNEIDIANGFLCIGYGFNDIHVQPKLIAQIKREKPIIVITRKLSDIAKKSIIDNKCKHYLLLEEDANPNDTKLYSSDFGEQIIKDVKYWTLEQYLKLIK